MHHMDSDIAYREKATREPYKNAMSYIEQATSNKAAVVQPLTSHLTNHPNKKNKACRTLLEKQGQTHEGRFIYGLLHMDVPMLADLLLLFFFLRWEVNGCVTSILCDVASSISLIEYIVLLCSSQQAFSLSVLFASILYIHGVVWTQQQLERNTIHNGL